MGKQVKRLFEQFQPENYKLHLVPDREGKTFAGTVSISGKKVGRPSKRLTFHQNGLTVSKAKLVKHDKKGDTIIEVSRINRQNSLDEVRLHTDEQLFPGLYSVTLEFSGQITSSMVGIYPCNFKLNGRDKQLIATQFESHFARQAFPCIDEPEAKATFDLSLETPVGETVVANTPVKQQTTMGKSLVTCFETTPRMSTYLLAFAYGEFGYKESKTKDGVKVRVYATTNKVNLTDFALDTAVRCLEFFTDYFGVPYPLPKFDVVAVPDFDAAAMENWGLTTYRESVALVDPKSTSIESKQLVAMVIAHEISHMWFGDLVTMKWWNDIWLNESFANLMEYFAVDALYPEWQVWEHFVMQETGSAKRRDSLPDVQPIQAEVRHPDEIGALFDPSIVYAKGGSVLRMLYFFIGEKAFREGLQAYFKKHAYGNTEAKDLWAAFSDSSRQNIAAFMESWLTAPGFPLVDIEWNPAQSGIKLAQQRFLSDPTVKPKKHDWPVPLAATWPLSNGVFSQSQASVEAEPLPEPEKPLVFNYDGQSYYLPHYTNAEHLASIVRGIERGNVDTIDRQLLMDGYTMLQRGGYAGTTELLELLSAYGQERSESVWSAISVALSETRKLIEGDEKSDADLDGFIANLVTELLKDFEWDDKPGDSAQTLRLRGLVYSLAASGKIKSVLDEGLERFRKAKLPSDLPASTRSVMFFIATRYGGNDDFKKLLDLYRTIDSADEKDEIASGLTSAKVATRYRQLIAMLDTDTIRRQDLMHWYVWLLRNRYSRSETWQWLIDHWDWIVKEFASDKSFGYFARYAGSVFSTAAEQKQFNSFFGPKKQIIAMSRNITLAEQEIASRIAWRQRNETAVKRWLANHRVK